MPKLNSKKLVKTFMVLPVFESIHPIPFMAKNIEIETFGYSRKERKRRSRKIKFSTLKSPGQDPE